MKKVVYELGLRLAERLKSGGPSLGRSPGAHKQRRPVNQDQIQFFGEIGSTQFLEQGLPPCSFFFCGRACFFCSKACALHRGKTTRRPRDNFSEIPKFRLPADPNHFYILTVLSQRGACARHGRGAGCDGRWQRARRARPAGVR